MVDLLTALDRAGTKVRDFGDRQASRALQQAQLAAVIRKGEREEIEAINNKLFSKGQNEEYFTDVEDTGGVKLASSRDYLDEDTNTLDQNYKTFLLHNLNVSFGDKNPEGFQAGDMRVAPDGSGVIIEGFNDPLGTPSPGVVTDPSDPEANGKVVVIPWEKLDKLNKKGFRSQDGILYNQNVIDLRTQKNLAKFANLQTQKERDFGLEKLEEQAKAAATAGAQAQKNKNQILREIGSIFAELDEDIPKDEYDALLDQIGTRFNLSAADVQAVKKSDQAFRAEIAKAGAATPDPDPDPSSAPAEEELTPAQKQRAKRRNVIESPERLQRRIDAKRKTIEKGGLLGSISEARKKNLERDIEELEAKKQQAIGSAAPSSAIPEPDGTTSNVEDEVIKSVDAPTIDEMVAKIEAADITPTQITEIAETLRKANVTSSDPAELEEKLGSRRKALAALITIAGSFKRGSTEQTNAIKNVYNFLGTGSPTMTENQAATIEEKQRELDLKEQKFEEELAKNAQLTSDDKKVLRDASATNKARRQAVRDITFPTQDGETTKTLTKKTAFTLITQTFNKSVDEIQELARNVAADPEGNLFGSQASQNVLKDMINTNNMILSQALQALATDGEGRGVVANLIDDLSNDNPAGNFEEDLGNFTVSGDTLYYEPIDPTSGNPDVRGRGITRDSLAKINPNVARIVFENVEKIQKIRQERIENARARAAAQEAS